MVVRVIDRKNAKNRSVHPHHPGRPSQSSLGPKLRDKTNRSSTGLNPQDKVSRNSSNTARCCNLATGLMHPIPWKEAFGKAVLKRVRFKADHAKDNYDHARQVPMSGDLLVLRCVPEHGKVVRGRSEGDKEMPDEMAEFQLGVLDVKDDSDRIEESAG